MRCWNGLPLMRQLAERLLVMLIRVYRYAISPLLGSNCRFHPSCSAYALESIQLHGAVRGSWLALRRLARCHPWHEGGIDPVPGARDEAHHCETHS